MKQTSSKHQANIALKIHVHDACSKSAWCLLHRVNTPLVCSLPWPPAASSLRRPATRTYLTLGGWTTVSDRSILRSDCAEITDADISIDTVNITSVIWRLRYTGGVCLGAYLFVWLLTKLHKKVTRKFSW